MEINTYIITFNPSGVDIDRVNREITQSPLVLAYWNHIPFVYCVKTQVTPDILRASLYHLFDNTLFLIAKIDPRQVDGRQYSEAWQWFYSDTLDPNKVLSSPGGVVPPFHK